MSVLQGAANTTISGGTYVAAASGSTVHIHQADQYGTMTNLPSVSRTVGSQELSAHAAHTALYNSSARFDAPRCHRNTRASYLDRLERWMLGHSQEYADARLIWLTGGAGAGKSAILQSIVERTVQYTAILGTFFFSRADPSRNHAEVLIPTLAYQLARAFPPAAAVLDSIIERDPLIFKASLQTQTHELLVRPLLHLLDTGAIVKRSPTRLLLVIDGLDECDDPQKQALIIHVITGILCDHQLPVSFLIASRPEIAITQAFQRESRAHSMLETITLDANNEAESDIRRFIEDSFLDIRETHPMRDYIPWNWPSPHTVDRLVKKSSGHFIYAATAMRFILSSDEHPERALRVIQGLEPSRTGSPFAELDALYKHIITSARHSSEVLWILRHCCSGYFANTATAICFMRSDYSPRDVLLYLSDVHALVSVSPDRQAEIHVSLKHASLSEFLYNKQRSELLHVPLETHFASLLPRYFGMLDLNDPKLAASLLMGAHAKVTDVTFAWMIAIRGCPDVGYLHYLLNRYTPGEVWALSKQCAVLGPRRSKGIAISMVSSYLRGIRDSVANHDNALYTQQVGMFIQSLLDDTNTQYQILPGLLFSATPPDQGNLNPTFLIRILSALNLPNNLSDFFSDLMFYLPVPLPMYQADYRHLNAVRLMLQNQFSRGTEMTLVLQLVLQRLSGYSWTPEYLEANQHRQWLQKTKPLKHGSLGTPRLASAFYSNLFRLPRPKFTTPAISHSLAALHLRALDGAVDIAERREEIYCLLTAVICFLPRSEGTREVAALARRSLPMAALWFPKLMRKVRRALDAYVVRWEVSPEGLLEATRSMLINDLD